MLFCIPVATSVLMVSLSSCHAAAPGPTPSPVLTEAELTQVADDILADPKQFEGRSVTLVGYFRGWDLLGEVGSGPPVTRSDWVIRDDSGAIYVRAGIAVEGEIHLDPSSRQDMGKVLRLTGIVRLAGDGRPYIDPQRIEIIK